MPDERKNLQASVRQRLLNTDVLDDGLDFQTDSIHGQAIREEALYDGIRIRLNSTLGRARIPLQIDIGFGDAASPMAVELVYPTLLDQTPPTVLAYRPEYVVAEKLEALVALGEINTRLKDYYDLWRLTRTMDLPHDDVVAAVRATFARRGSAIPADMPPGLADGFA